MKKKRTLIVGLLLVAALALGIGYAGFTSDLSLGGKAILDGVSESKVVIKNIEIEAGNSSGDHIVATPGNLNTEAATVDVTGFKAPTDYAILTVTVANPHPFAVNMTAPNLVINDNDIAGGTYFDITLDNSTPIPTSIGAEDEITFQIKVEANVITPDAHTTSFTVTFSASAGT